jgi:hypothetical protein
MGPKGDNCRNCDDFKSKKCLGEADECICMRCPRNIGKCKITHYCSETESVLD